jgi:hypothetical protein
MKFIFSTLIIFLIASSHIITCTKKISNISKSRTTAVKLTKENGTNFAKGVISEFLGVDSACLGGKLENQTVELKERVTPDLEGIISGMMVIRYQIYNFFNKKFDEWVNSNRRAACDLFQKTLGKVISVNSINKKEAKYQGKVDLYQNLRDSSANSYYALDPLLIEVIGGLSSARESQIFDIVNTELTKLNDEVIKFLQAFKSSFADAVQIYSLNDLQSQFANMSGYGDLTQICDQPRSVWQKTLDTANKLKGYYTTFTQTSLGCILTSYSGVKSIITAVISTTFLFAPGLNTIAIIWRATKLALYMGKAIYNFYKAWNEARLDQKWILYGKSFGAFLRGIVYLAAGARKRNIKRRLMNKKL